MESTQILFFDEIHIQQISGLLTTSRLNEYNLFLRDKYGEVDLENGIYDMNNKPKKATFKYEEEGRFYIVVAKVKVLYGKRTVKRCPVFGFMGKNIFTIDSYRKEILK